MCSLLMFLAIVSDRIMVRWISDAKTDSSIIVAIWADHIASYCENISNKISALLIIRLTPQGRSGTSLQAYESLQPAYIELTGLPVIVYSQIFNSLFPTF
jgi:hypothetical protein